MNRFFDFIKNSSGATATEYGLMVALISATIIVTVSSLGISLVDLYSEVVNALS